MASFILLPEHYSHTGDKRATPLQNTGRTARPAAQCNLKTLNVDSASTRGQAVPTPETDAAIWRDVGGEYVRVEVSRRLEVERDRLLAVNKTLVEALEKLLVYHSYAINGSRGGAQGAADVEYHFNKARAALKAGKV